MVVLRGEIMGELATAQDNRFDSSRERVRIATESHMDDRDCSGISFGSNGDIGIEKKCSLKKNKSVERGCQEEDQENSDRNVIRLVHIDSLLDRNFRLCLQV